MSEQRDHRRICEYLAYYHVVTLATQDAEGLWCANCFYVFEEATMSLYIMTDDKARHTQALMAQAEMAGTVADQTKNIAQIQGIQFTGVATRVADADVARVKSLYCAQFPVARLKSAPLWRIALNSIKMTDNTLGFGKKHVWQRMDG
jgi:uncharacterized protein YhbP (UPF0306 family)